MGAIADFYANADSLSWSLSSKKDPRWNCSGRGGEAAVRIQIEALKSEYGNQPDDLEIFACVG
jgi:hypothetical protein